MSELTWTSEKPTTPGWYWHRGIGHYGKPYIEVVLVVFDDDAEFPSRHYLSAIHHPEQELSTCTADDWFAGPIPEPVEAK